MIRQYPLDHLMMLRFEYQEFLSESLLLQALMCLFYLILLPFQGSTPFVLCLLIGLLEGFTAFDNVQQVISALVHFAFGRWANGRHLVMLRLSLKDVAVLFILSLIYAGTTSLDLAARI